jgi:protein involved in polysaccharide export with SLBB domain
MIGDKLELRLYERFETNDQQLINRQEQGRTGNEFALQTEITGFYEVQPNGMMTVPILGNIAADGVPLAQISEDVIKRYSDTFKRSSSASLVISERRPVFIVGSVAHSGTYPFTRGMTPLHLVALAGGLVKPSVSCVGSDQAARDLLEAPNAFHALRAEAGTTTEISLPGNAPICPGDLLVVP